MTELLHESAVQTDITEAPLAPQQKLVATYAIVRDRYSAFAESHPITATIAETLGVWTVDTLAYTLSPQETGHMSVLASDRAKNPRRFDLETVTVIPVIEELLYRTGSWLAAKTHPTSRSIQLACDVYSSFRFAEIHRADGDSFAVPEFACGMHLARLARHRGLGHAILAHALYNSSSILLSAIAEGTSSSHAE